MKIPVFGVAVIILLSATMPAAAKRIPCVAVSLAIKWTGSEEGAEAYAKSRGYTPLQIAEARRRCLGKRE